MLSLSPCLAPLPEWRSASRAFFASRLRMRVAEERVKALARDALGPKADEDRIQSIVAELAGALEEIAAAEDERVAPEDHGEVKEKMERLAEERG